MDCVRDNFEVIKESGEDPEGLARTLNEIERRIGSFRRKRGMSVLVDIRNNKKGGEGIVAFEDDSQKHHLVYAVIKDRCDYYC